MHRFTIALCRDEPFGGSFPVKLMRGLKDRVNFSDRPIPISAAVRSDKSRTMIPKRQLAAAMWVAILMIAVLFVPTLAQAHAGHDHAPPPIASVAQLETPDAGDLNVDLTLSNDDAAVPGRAVVASASDFFFVPNRTCHGSCCEKGSAGCCPVAAPNAPASPAAPRIASGIGPFAIDVAPGIDPEAIPEPPKFFT
jgi:hypothetical protein